MNSILMKMIFTILVFVFIFLTGYWLGHTGKPYAVLIFTLHKLMALGMLIFVGVTLYPVLKTAGRLQIVCTGMAALGFLFTIVSGGLLSVDKEMPALIHWLHRLLPYLTLLSSLAALYLF
ncbi:MAG: hypothetical protein LWX83_10425 [Anaerolineae bacterium]|nr:hypothetical protein [Anaerolineae bacterium]